MLDIRGHSLGLCEKNFSSIIKFLKIFEHFIYFSVLDNTNVSFYFIFLNGVQNTSFVFYAHGYT